MAGENNHVGDSATDVHGFERGSIVSAPGGGNNDHRDNSHDIDSAPDGNNSSHGVPITYGDMDSAPDSKFGGDSDSHDGISSALGGKGKVHSHSYGGFSLDQLSGGDAADDEDGGEDQFREVQFEPLQVDNDEDQFRHSYFSASSFRSDGQIESAKMNSKKRMGSCCNCTRKLRALSCTQHLFERHHYFFVATIVIQILLFCVFAFNRNFGFFTKREDLPTLGDCGDSSSKFDSTVFALAISFILNLMQMVADAFAVFVAILFVRQMQFSRVVMQYFLLALVVPRYS